jgi:hypothetical protein
MRAFVIYGKKTTDNIAMFIFKVFFYLLFVGIISQTYNIDKKSAYRFPKKVIGWDLNAFKKMENVNHFSVKINFKFVVFNCHI